MRQLSKRIEALELRQYATARWHRVIQRIEQTEEEARTLYERANGPIGPDEGIILRQMVAPGGVQCPA